MTDTTDADSWPKLVEITAMVHYSVVIYADSEAQALQHVESWEHSWHASADLIGISDIDVLNVRAGDPEDAHEIIAFTTPRDVSGSKELWHVAREQGQGISDTVKQRINGVHKYGDSMGIYSVY